MSDLRSKLIRLAHANPELRGDLLPLIKESKTARAVNPDTTSWNNLSQSVTNDLHQAMHSLEDLSFTMDGKWDSYLEEGPEFEKFLKTRSEVVAAIRGLNKVEKAWRDILTKMR